MGAAAQVVSAYQSTTKDEGKTVSLVSNPRQNGRPEFQRAFFYLDCPKKQKAREDGSFHSERLCKRELPSW